MTFDEFITQSEQELKIKVYPVWKEALKVAFTDGVKEVFFSGELGTGKTTACLIGMAYQLYLDENLKREDIENSDNKRPCIMIPTIVKLNAHSVRPIQHTSVLRALFDKFFMYADLGAYHFYPKEYNFLSSVLFDRNATENEFEAGTHYKESNTKIFWDLSVEESFPLQENSFASNHILEKICSNEWIEQRLATISFAIDDFAYAKVLRSHIIQESKAI